MDRSRIDKSRTTTTIIISLFEQRCSNDLFLLCSTKSNRLFIITEIFILDSFHGIEYAVETEQGLSENSRLILNRCALNAQQRKRFKEGESIDQIIEHEEPVEKMAEEAEPRLVKTLLHPSNSTHSISLKKSEHHLPTERYSHPLYSLSSSIHSTCIDP